MANINNKRITINTLFLALRSLITLVVSLYTSRIVLDVLGVIDYGLYNVVGGIVVMLGFINTAMTAGTQRFLSFELGRKNFIKLQKTFSALLTLHIILAFIIFLLAETVGLWFLEHHFIIPSERMEAARWVYHLSVISAMVTVTQVPYNSSIIAHERMNIFAYISIIQVLLKLLIVFILMYIEYDKLKLYSILFLAVIILTTLIYRVYCKRNFIECNYKFEWDIKLLKSLINFSSWNTFGGFAHTFVDQGINFLINIFFGPAINAARAVAMQVKISVSMFVSSFQSAVNPQIVKTYAKGDHKNNINLIYSSSKFSFFIIFLLTFPVITETEFILDLWLKSPPDYTIIFIQLILIDACIETLSGPLISAVQATGKVKIYQITISSARMLIFPISYIAFKLTNLPESTLYISILINLIVLFLRVLILSKLIDIKLKDFYTKVVTNIFQILIIPIFIVNFIHYILDYGSLRFIVSILVCLFSTLISIYLLGLTNNEKNIIKNHVSNFINKKV